MRGAYRLNGLVRFAERRNLVSARVPSHFNWPLQKKDDIEDDQTPCHKHQQSATSVPPSVRQTTFGTPQTLFNTSK
jgi:hypothetical protein